MKKYRLTIYPDMDFYQSKGKQFEFDTLKEMVTTNNAIADILLFTQDELSMMKSTSNMFISEELVDGLYEEVDEAYLLTFDE